MFKNLPFRKGFSITEFLIVLVLVGIIAGGVLMANSLVRQTRLKSVVAEYNEIKHAVDAFYGEYNAFPGDMVSAYEEWGAQCDESAPDCNGDGDKKIEFSGSGSGLDNESFRAFQHLSLAAFLTGTYTGKGDGSGNQATPGVNIRASSLEMPDGSLTGYYFHEEEDGHTILTLGGVRRGREASAGAISPLEAWEIDKKMDDGKAENNGKIWATGGASGDEEQDSRCVSGDSYLVAGEEGKRIHCILHMRLE